jgi:uncharacterized protein (TIGR02453 family)
MSQILPETLQFLENLAANNNKPWFEANRKTYEIARKNYEGFAEELIKLIAEFDNLGDLKVKDAMFRINRDVRFSANKMPYKQNFSSVIVNGGRKAIRAPYYFHLQPEGSFLGGGFWGPEPATLAIIRQEIDYNSERFLSIINEPAFKKLFPNLGGEKLTRPPKGYDAENPMIEYIKHKSIVTTFSYTNKQVTEPGFVKTLAKHCQVMKPLLDFLNEPLNTKPE